MLLFAVLQNFNIYRVSVDLSTAEAVGFMRDAVDRLNELWDAVHMEERMRKRRIDTFYSHIKETLNQMVSIDE